MNMEWRDISEAPKDGTPILGWDGSSMTVILYTYGEWQLAECGSYAEDADWEPIKWQPLPPPPKEKE